MTSMDRSLAFYVTPYIINEMIDHVRFLMIHGMGTIDLIIGSLTVWGVPMSPVYFKKFQCYLSLLLIYAHVACHYIF